MENEVTTDLRPDSAQPVVIQPLPGATPTAPHEEFYPVAEQPNDCGTRATMAPPPSYDAVMEEEGRT